MTLKKSTSAALGCLFALVGPSFGAMAADPDHPTVVELFQSQGCSSCPPANANLLALSDRPDLLTLSWEVTYWDDLGWKDTFGAPAFTARQWDYAHAFHRAEVFTPEIVVNGRADTVGADRTELERTIVQTDHGAGGPRITVSDRNVTISGDVGSAVVVLVRFDPRIINVPILRGENGGRVLPHRNVVRQVSRIGTFAGGSRTYAIPDGHDSALRSAILVEAFQGGPILAAARLPG